MSLNDADIEAIARRVVELLPTDVGSARVRLVDATELARALAVERDWVYAHARELGAIRLGGRQGRLRFDLVEVRRRLAGEPKSARADRRAAARRPRSRTADGVDLLPYEES